MGVFMRIYPFGANCFFESCDFHEGRQSYEWPYQHHFAITRCITRRKLFRELIDLNGSVCKTDGIALLKAHGGMDKYWYFADGQRKYNVQNWINLLDGKFAAILLYMCNPNNSEISSQHSIIVHSKDCLNVKDLVHGGHFRLYFPNEGYFDESKKLRSLIDKLKN
jgi:hypothetical protein